jgi:hypothetical protein
MKTIAKATADNLQDDQGEIEYVPIVSIAEGGFRTPLPKE